MLSDDKNLEDSSADEKCRSPRDIELTSFPEPSANVDENGMKDVQLYGEGDATEDSEDTAPKENGKTTEKDQPSTSAELAEQTTVERTEQNLDESDQKFESLSSISDQLGRTVVIHSRDETSEETFERLKQACIDGTLAYKDIIDSLFNTLVGGSFDLESRYVIENAENINRMLELIDLCPPNAQAEIWSVFVAIVRKSFLNLEAITKAGLISKCLDRLPQADSVTADLLTELLTVSSSYSISVKEVKYLLRSLQSSNGSWKANSLKLLDVLQEIPKREGPDVFFSFPGKASAGISLPPLSRWPHQNGWTFSTWLRMDPLNSVYFEKEKPYLFSLCTPKGLGYFCYFMGNCLVLRCIRTAGKEVMRCIKHELVPRKWHHIALSFVYSRWAKSEIHCFIDGCLVEVIDANWFVSTNEHYDRCFIGCGLEANLNEAFSGQMAAVYVFSTAISPQQAACLHVLGVSYQSQFKHEAETNLPESYKKVLFDGRLHDSLVFAYCPKNCHGQLCLFQQSSQKGGVNPYFVQIPHAVMKNGVEVVTTQSVHSSLHSVGGIQMLLPLFSHIDLKQPEAIDNDICAKLLNVIAVLLNTSLTAQQQLLHSQGFSVVANVLNNAASQHLSLNLLETFISISKSLPSFSTGIPLLKQLIENVFFTPQLWYRAESAVQVRLFTFLANDLFSNGNLLSIVRRTHTFVTLMHTLKKYYWVVPPSQQAHAKREQQLERTVIVHIRACILQLLNLLMFTMPADMDEKEVVRDDEFQCLFNFISTVQEEDNLYDVLGQISNQLADHPAIMVPAFDRKKAHCVVFKLICSGNELIRIPALKIFGYYLCRSTQKRKNESINQKNLFHLLTEKLLLNSRTVSLATYNALYEILVEQICPEILFVKHEDSPLDSTRFENHQMLKVIAQLLGQSEECPELLRVKKIFLQDIIRLCKCSRENRRTILQMSVWQEWLISLAYIFPENEQQQEVMELVHELFSVLLFHAIRLEYGGWRVWVDTMAITHSKVSWQKYRRKAAHREKRLAEKTNLDEQSSNDGTEPIALYRTPDFTWSKVHVRLLSDLLESIESVVREWNESASPMADHMNNSDNQVFIANTIHILSQLNDSLVMACGGLLPLLAAATAPNSELDIVDTTQQELDIADASRFLAVFVELSDVFVFTSAVSLNELEQEKNMPSGGILRQSLRLASTIAVRNILICIAQKEEIFNSNSPKFDAIRKFISNGTTTAISDTDRLLQNIDLQRLKGVIYRDMEETRQAQFLALAVIYFLSVLMVSRYRDILEPSTTTSPFFANNNGNGSEEEENAVVPKRTTTMATVREDCNGEGAEKKNAVAEEETEEIELNDDADDQGQRGIASIRCKDTQPVTSKGNEYGPGHLSGFNAPNLRRQSVENTGERRQYLTNKLQQALESVMPLFREVLTDFRAFLQKTLLGTHGQEIMNDVRVMQSLKNGTVVEIVMLLCSQEWQTSLQKHAGLAFIELVNEGRLMAHATRDHILRVANEADFILNRLRAEDVSKHAQFESEANEQLANRRAEEHLADQLIVSAKHREFVLASRTLEKMRSILISPKGAWSTDTEKKKVFWKLDAWEDDSRRRRRFVQNPWGKKHALATIQRTGEQQKEVETDQDEFLKDLAHKMIGHTKGTAKEYVDETEIEKWLKDESDVSEPIEDYTTYSTAGKLIAPGLVVPGTISLTATDLFFDADEEHPLNKRQNALSLRYCDNLHARWNFQEIRAVFLRRYLLQFTALELFLASRTAIMFAFPDHETVKKVVAHLPKVGVGVKYGLPQSRKASLMTPRQLFKHSDMPQKWQQREISNFDYLMFLNTVAGRTYNDLNQYPVFPWVLSNYTSEKLDLSEASNFRDLSKPIGALSESRRKYFQERFNNWDDNEIPAFHYGTHYSTQAFTLNWLFRIEPFTTLFLDLQSGKFDHSNRLFHSLAETWERCLVDTHDVKELIPELFYLPEMFSNANEYDLGVREDGITVNDVVLPCWANGSAEEFVRIHRQALESDLVSCQLSSWIDLIFGYKQRGPEAVRATNVFYHLTYEGSVNLDSVENAALRESIQQQILNFGQTPVQLLAEPHPPRHSVMTMSPLMFQPCSNDLRMLMKFISNSPVVHITANTYQQLSDPSVVTIAQNLVFALNRWNADFNQVQSQPSGGVHIGNTEKSPASADPSKISTAELPITVDPLLAVGNPSQKVPKRHLGDQLDQRLNISSNNFICTVDSRFIFVSGYPDYSFRLIETESAQVRQVVFGHGNVVTCLARSETSLFADCYIASGSSDCTVVLWHFSQHLGAVVGEYNVAGESPSPRAVLTGHDAEISAICVSAEHGIVISGSKDGTVLMHTTQGDLLRHILCEEEAAVGLQVDTVLFSRDCHIAVFYGNTFLATFTTTGKQLNTPLHRSKEKVLCAVLSRDGEYIVLGTECGRISVLRMFPLQSLYTFAQTDSPIRSLAVSTNQRLIFGGLDSGAVVVFNVDFTKWHFEYGGMRYSKR